MSPFKSEKQRRYLYTNEPVVAKEFAKKTPKGKKLPEKVKKKKSAAFDLSTQMFKEAFLGLGKKKSKPKPDTFDRYFDEEISEEELWDWLESDEFILSPNSPLKSTDLKPNYKTDNAKYYKEVQQYLKNLNKANLHKYLEASRNKALADGYEHWEDLEEDLPWRNPTVDLLNEVHDTMTYPTMSTKEFDDFVDRVAKNVKLKG